MVAAHGIGGRTDLPLPTPLAVSVAVLAVAISFIALNARRVDRRPAPPDGGAVPAATELVGDTGWLRTGLRALSLVALVFVVVVALRGPAPEGLNLSPYALYITFWVGLVPASLLLGPVVRFANPLRLVNRGIDAAFGVPPDAPGARPTPGWLGWWPAAAWLSAFVWLELVLPDRGNPRVVGGFILLYVVVNRLAATVYGNTWHDRGDGFEAYSNVVASLSPWGRGANGRLTVRNPVDGALQLAVGPGMLALILVLIGSTAFDGLTRTRYWVESVPSDSIALGTLGLVLTTATIAGLYWATMAAAAALARPAAGDPAPPGLATAERNTRWMARTFAPALVPIAVGYAIAHYASLFLYEGQEPGSC